MTDWTADPLIWGEGKTRFEMCLEPTCPFSGAAFDKLEPLLRAARGQISVRIWLHSQPWHLLSPIVSRAIAGASTLSGGKSDARHLMAVIYANRDTFVFEDHVLGPNRARTPDEILGRLSDLSGLDVVAGFERHGLEDVVKHHAKYARQNGIHGSPTVMVDGLVRDDIQSGDDIGTWLDAIRG